MKERTLIFFKPNITKNKEEINALIKFFKGMRVVKYELRRCPMEIFREFYEHVPEPYLSRHAKFCSSGPIGIAILEGNNAIERVRKIIGCTNSSKASPKTFRGYYYRKYRPKYGYDNFIHASENKEAVDREKKFFKIWI
ncbi:MAG: nucleoside-diphosphate kinase [Candidatus Pacebacteria bacterium]|nr:nucleoside-diphosphate kinase [Candidatus Paceibacterota bacterium]